MAGSSINVALVGMTGVGKSTLINILKGSEVAEANNDVKPCTLKATCYEVGDSETGTYHIWDTRGLNEASSKRPGLLSWVFNDANAQLKNVLSDKNINVVLLCIEWEKIGIAAHREVHTKIPTDIKVAVVVTRMGKELEDIEWKETCKGTAGPKQVVFDTNLMEGVPTFKNLQEQKMKVCRGKILALISRCR
ncbi:hypothetical protein PAXINDRAFT_166876 [Paxillus involutus ATCC 200175]|nr:hypothetical protein PAXINDRAFT_166876 [Paxillus involutus ATCC 200175]